MIGSPEDRDRQLELIGLQQKLFTRLELQQARKTGRDQNKSSLSVLVERGLLTPEQARGLERAVTYRIGRDEDKEIAKIVVDSNYCAAPAVEVALRRQKEFYSKTGELMRLGVLLVEGQNLTESQRVAAYKIHGIERRGSSSTQGRLSL